MSMYSAPVVSDANEAVPVAPPLGTRSLHVGLSEWVAAAGLALAVSVVLTCVKVVRLNETHADDALFLQLTQNIAQRGVGLSQLAATILDFFKAVFVASAQTIATAPLAPTPLAEFNEFRIHSYYILYPIGMLARIIPRDILLEVLFVSSFVGFVLLAYIAARRRGLSPFVALTLCCLIVWHPAWADGVEWEFYPDRLFVLLGFGLMLAASSSRLHPLVLLTLAVLCASINERAAAIGGLFLVAHTVLFWRAAGRRRAFDIAIGAAMLLYAFAILKWSIQNKGYSGFFPANTAELLALFNAAATRHAIELFLLASGALLLLSLFELRATVIALLLMLPNILGNYGGAEKLGWQTHYHDLYLPALAWAALMGLTAAKERFRGQLVSRAVPALAAGLFAVVFFSDFRSGMLSASAYNNAFIHRLPDEVRQYLGPYGTELRADADRVRSAVPKGAMISSIEGGMPIIYEDRQVEYYPLGIDRADYILVARAKMNGQPTITGAVSALGPSEIAKINAVLEKRLRQDKFDIDHPLVETVSGLVLIRRR
jgi:hypothetical protein